MLHHDVHTHAWQTGCSLHYTVGVAQGSEKVKAAQQEAEALKRETALAAAALEGRTQALARQEAAAAEAKALLAMRTKELDNREASKPLLACPV